jgi:hypothetical protein
MEILRGVGRVFEIVNYCRRWLAKPPLQIGAIVINLWRSIFVKTRFLDLDTPQKSEGGHGGTAPTETGLLSSSIAPCFLILSKGRSNLFCFPKLA